MNATMTDQSISSIPIGLIDPCPVNPRKTFDEAQLAELSMSIAKMGVTNPIIVRPGWSPVRVESDGRVTNGALKQNDRYELVCGHRRTEAAKRSGLAEIPAMVRELSDAEALDLAIVDNLQRVDLSPMEEAEGYATLMKVAGAGPDELEAHAGEIALKAGKTLRYVIQRLKLLALIPEARYVMRRGFLSLDCALLIARLQPEDQDRAVLFAVDHRKGGKGETLQQKLDDAIKSTRAFRSTRQARPNRLRVSVALAMAANPKLRIIRIMHGEAMDDDAMTVLAEMAEEHDFQVWVAKVDSSGKVGIVMEDGMVKEASE